MNKNWKDYMKAKANYNQKWKAAKKKYNIEWLETHMPAIPKIFEKCQRN